jgi:CheY-like chemotaxis protein
MNTNDTWLLVEDDVDDQDFFVMVLTSITDKVNCVIAKNGLEALKIIHKDDSFLPSCIFVDLNMPIMNGFDFLQNVNKIERLAEIPRIVYTTSNAAFDKELVKKLGAGFVTKYTSFVDLQKFLRDCLFRHTGILSQFGNAASESGDMKNPVIESYESIISNFEAKLVNLKNHDNYVDNFYNLLVDSAMKVMNSDLASIQLFCNITQQLKLIASRNFHPRSIEFWQTVSAASGSVCGEALRKQTRITVKDVETIDFAKDELGVFRVSGIRAVQSTPLVSRQGKLIGMISTHWKEQRQFSEKDFKFFDAFAELATDIIGQKTQ